jgi:hypothetical protein
MTEKKSTNKSQMVRDYLKANPAASNKEVSDALAQEGLKVSPQHVATIKANSKMRKKTVKTAVRKVGSDRGISIPDIRAAFALLKVTGSLTAAKAALDAAEEIKGLV